MRADMIMVVKDGEIIENGSHEELVNLKGKYYSLYTKQFRTLLPHERSLSKSPRKDPIIINDLSPERKTAELVIKELNKANLEGNNTVLQTLLMLGTLLTIFQVPKLKADAPEFVPKHLRQSTNDTDYSSLGGSNQDPTGQAKHVKDPKKHRTESRKPRLSLGKKSGLKSAKRVEELVGK
jgi:ABC-type glutathione transport system ATPase component